MAAAGRGNIEVTLQSRLSMAREDILLLVKRFHSQGCSWSKGAYSASALNGNLEMLQWMRSQGCPSNEETSDAAAWIGNLEMLLLWLHSEGCPWNEGTCKAAATWKCCNRCVVRAVL